MAGFSDYIAAKILNQTLRGVAIGTAATPVYVALFTASPTSANITANELSSGSSPGYARVSMASTDWNAPSGDACTNATPVTFPTATGGWAGTITYFGVYDASTGGNLLYFGPLAASKTVNSGDALTFAVGGLVIALS